MLDWDAQLVSTRRSLKGATMGAYSFTCLGGAVSGQQLTVLIALQQMSFSFCLPGGQSRLVAAGGLNGASTAVFLFRFALERKVGCQQRRPSLVGLDAEAPVLSPKAPLGYKWEDCRPGQAALSSLTTKLHLCRVSDAFSQLTVLL